MDLQKDYILVDLCNHRLKKRATALENMELWFVPVATLIRDWRDQRFLITIGIYGK